MRYLASLLLAALIGTGYTAPMDCCDHGRSETSDSSCHQVPASPMPCHEVRASDCGHLLCEPERPATLAAAWRETEPRTSHSPSLLPADLVTHTQPQIAWAGDSNLQLAQPVPSGKLFLRIHVLLI